MPVSMATSSATARRKEEMKGEIHYIHYWLSVMVSCLKGYLQNFLYISIIALYFVCVESRRRLIPFGLTCGRTSQSSWIPSSGQTTASLREFCGQTLPPTASSTYKHAPVLSRNAINATSLDVTCYLIKSHIFMDVCMLLLDSGGACTIALIRESIHGSPHLTALWPLERKANSWKKSWFCMERLSEVATNHFYDFIWTGWCVITVCH